MNKHREQAIIKGFVRWGPHPGLFCQDLDRERPDALLADGHRLIGVEVTAITEADPRQAVPPQRWTKEVYRIVDEAQKMFAARNGHAVVVRFEMNPSWLPPKRGDLSTVAEGLATLVERTLISPPQWPFDREPYELHNPIPEVSWVYISRSEYGNHWQPAIGGGVRSVSEADLVATITRKEVELPVYRQAASEIWLLIDCDVSGQGIALDVPKSRLEIESGFDRIFCCGFGMWEWVEVSVRTGARKAG